MLAMKIYTRTGDDGTTGLIGGSRLPKSDPRIDCYGTVDELNAALGLAAVAAPATLLNQLREVQSDLFVIGTYLATPDPSAGNAASGALDQKLVERLERQIDAADSVLPPLRNFILPGGSELAARLHLARTICRRAERMIVELSERQPIAPILLAYVNRLSDWLFVQARLANHIAGITDIAWTGSR